jgi:predicted phosphodiesterase
MVEIQIASDLHIEYKNDEIPNPLDYITPVADILILAGDIGSLYKIEQLEGFLCKLCVYFKHVIYVPGNHEYYTFKEYNQIGMNLLLSRLYKIEQNIKNLYVLNKSSIMVENICITGCTLWSDLKISIPKFIVRIFGITDELYTQKFNSDLHYLKKMIDHCDKNNYKLVVVTHYCPSYTATQNCKKRDRYISLYTSDLDYLLDTNKIDTWICGHIHSNFDYKHNQDGTRVVSNQRGKPKDKITDYLKNFVIKI